MGILSGRSQNAWTSFFTNRDSTHLNETEHRQLSSLCILKNAELIFSHPDPQAHLYVSRKCLGLKVIHLTSLMPKPPKIRDSMALALLCYTYSTCFPLDIPTWNINRDSLGGQILRCQQWRRNCNLKTHDKSILPAGPKMRMKLWSSSVGGD